MSSFTSLSYSGFCKCTMCTQVLLKGTFNIRNETRNTAKPTKIRDDTNLSCPSHDSASKYGRAPCVRSRTCHCLKLSPHFVSCLFILSFLTRGFLIGSTDCNRLWTQPVHATAAPRRRCAKTKASYAREFLKKKTRNNEESTK